MHVAILVVMRDWWFQITACLRCSQTVNHVESADANLVGTLSGFSLVLWLLYEPCKIMYASSNMIHPPYSVKHIATWTWNWFPYVSSNATTNLASFANELMHPSGNIVSSLFSHTDATVQHGYLMKPRFFCAFDPYHCNPFSYEVFDYRTLPTYTLDEHVTWYPVCCVLHKFIP